MSTTSSRNNLLRSLNELEAPGSLSLPNQPKVKEEERETDAQLKQEPAEERQQASQQVRFASQLLPDTPKVEVAVPVAETDAKPKTERKPSGAELIFNSIGRSKCSRITVAQLETTVKVQSEDEDDFCAIVFDSKDQPQQPVKYEEIDGDDECAIVYVKDRNVPFFRHVEKKPLEEASAVSTERVQVSTAVEAPNLQATLALIANEPITQEYVMIKPDDTPRDDLPPRSPVSKRRRVAVAEDVRAPSVTPHSNRREASDLPSVHGVDSRRSSALRVATEQNKENKPTAHRMRDDISSKNNRRCSPLPTPTSRFTTRRENQRITYSSTPISSPLSRRRREVPDVSPIRGMDSCSSSVSRITIAQNREDKSSAVVHRGERPSTPRRAPSFKRRRIHAAMQTPSVSSPALSSSETRDFPQATPVPDVDSPCSEDLRITTRIRQKVHTRLFSDDSSSIADRRLPPPSQPSSNRRKRDANGIVRRPAASPPLPYVGGPSARRQTAVATPIPAKNMKKMQRKLVQDQCIPRSAMLKVIKGISEEISSGNIGNRYKWQSAAVDAVHDAAEMFMTCMFEDANLLALHAKRVTVMEQDVRLLAMLRQRNFQDRGVHSRQA